MIDRGIKSEVQSKPVGLSPESNRLNYR
ncbi:hypothetical protein A3Q56_03723 [Intoshia linei]|uniref:Uncharacterized protein n=1 Tax=Intoshia linei TaxID=1819745 RepID=A0A177B2P8_9BILA|nr:hypothetical protein A3Q56_03723 [Intoshia linei]